MLRVFFFLLVSLSLTASAQKIAETRTTLLMGGRFDITIVAKDPQTAENNIDTVIAEITRIEKL